jgi:hypothetical protein
MQMVIVYIVIAMAVAYSLWRIKKRLTQVNDPCAGCQGCALKGKIKEKSECEVKKTSKYLAIRKK